jgi:two-component system chemotaxis response regulator CheY
MSKTVITVDDAATIRKMISFTLRGAGHTVIEASDGVDALAQLRGRSVDLVISDINMPRMDGLALTKALRDLELHRSTPIVLLTTESDPDKKTKGKQAGATAWLVKPFQPEQLLAVVTKIFSR